ncbi:MAG: chemotaxis protein CheW [Panacagrimonas sp.]
MIPETAFSDRVGDGAVLRRWIGFELAGQLYGVPILAVQEVLADAEVEPVPGAPPEVLGVINLRGQIVSVIDLHRRLGLAPSTRERGPLIVFDGDRETLAARVDRVSQVRQIADPAIKPALRVGATPCKAVSGRVTQGDEVMTLLNLPALLE